MSRFPAPPPREDPTPLDESAPEIIPLHFDNNNDDEPPYFENPEPYDSDEDEGYDEDYDQYEDEFAKIEQDYLTEQYLRDKRALFNREMAETIEEIDTTTVPGRNVISLVLRNDVPFVQRRIVTLLAKAISEQSLEQVVERTHDATNTSMLENAKTKGGNQDARDYSVQINICSKSDFIQRQNAKRSGYIETELADRRDNFNAELYFNSVDKMYSVRPGKPQIRAYSTAQLSHHVQEAQQQISPTQNQPKSENPLDAFRDDIENENSIGAQQKRLEEENRKRMEDQRLALEKASQDDAQKAQQSTFLLPGGLSFLPPNVSYDDINQLIEHGTSELGLNEWRDASVSGCPIGHIFLHSTLTQSTHQLMVNALSPLPTLIIYCADAQSLGRGRMQNSWVSPPGCLMYNFSLKVMNPTFLPFVQYYASWVHVKSITFALQHCCECSKCRLLPHNRIQTFSDKKSMSRLIKIAEKRVELQDNNPDGILEPCMDKVDIKIKWPNDLYIDGKKMSGTLLSSVCDMQANGGVTFTAHLGTGINVSNGYANGHSTFAQQHQNFITINDCIMASYQNQLRRNLEIVRKLELKEDQENQGDDFDESQLPALLDEDDMDMMLLEQQIVDTHLQRRIELATLQQQQEEFRQQQEKERAVKKQAKLAAKQQNKHATTGNKAVNAEEGEDGNTEGQNTAIPANAQNDDEDNDKEYPIDDEDVITPEEIALPTRTMDLPLLSREVLLASLTLNISQSLPHFNQFGFKPFETDYYQWWLHQDAVVTVDTAQGQGKGKYQIHGIDPQNGYLLAKNTTTGDLVELHPETHSFDLNTLTVKPKQPATPAQ